MTCDPSDILDLREAAEIAGRSEEAMRKACQRRSLAAKKIGGSGPRGYWVTTRSALVEYLAWSASRAHFLTRDEHGRILPRRNGPPARL